MRDGHGTKDGLKEPVCVEGLGRNGTVCGTFATTNTQQQDLGHELVLELICIPRSCPVSRTRLTSIDTHGRGLREVTISPQATIRGNSLARGGEKDLARKRLNDTSMDRRSESMSGRIAGRVPPSFEFISSCLRPRAGLLVLILGRTADFEATQ